MLEIARYFCHGVKVGGSMVGEKIEMAKDRISGVAKE